MTQTSQQSTHVHHQRNIVTGRAAPDTQHACNKNGHGQGKTKRNSIVSRILFHMESASALHSAAAAAGTEPPTTRRNHHASRRRGSAEPNRFAAGLRLLRTF